VEIGRSIRVSNLIEVIEGIDGVSYSKVIEPSIDIVPDKYQLPSVTTSSSWTITYEVDQDG
jgi:phage-related baseplate assembly protein